MSIRLRRELAKSLEAMEVEGLSAQKAAGRFPVVSERLLLLLNAMALLRTAPSAEPSSDFRRDARRRLLQGLNTSNAKRRPLRQPKLSRRPAMSWIVIGALVLTLFSGSTVAVAQAADGSIPGDLLYPLDTALESIRRTITTNPGARVELELIIAQERLDEAQQLEDEGGDDAGIQAALDAYAEAVNDATLALMAADLDDEGWAEMELLLTETRTLRDAVMNQIPLSAAEEARALAELALEQVEDVLGPVPVDELPPDKPIPSPDPDVPPTDDEDL